MSILGLGTDIVAVRRMEDLLARHGDRFLTRCFVAEERAALAGRGAAAVAARWAAKEAFLKALGGSIGHIPYGHIAVANAADGTPRLVPAGRAAEALAARGAGQVHLSLSHEREYAVATVVITA